MKGSRRDRPLNDIFTAPQREVLLVPQCVSPMDGRVESRHIPDYG
jgi:hypothetical protein